MISSNNPHSGIKLEELKTDVEYTFDINPSHEYKTIRGFKQSLYYQLGEMTKYATISLWVEYSPTGKLHSHGSVKNIHNRTKFVQQLLGLKNYGTYKVDTIQEDYRATRLAYQTKQQKIILDDTGIDTFVANLNDHEWRDQVLGIREEKRDKAKKKRFQKKYGDVLNFFQEHPPSESDHCQSD